jgi:hypothetical protein
MHSRSYRRPIGKRRRGRRGVRSITAKMDRGIATATRIGGESRKETMVIASGIRGGERIELRAARRILKMMVDAGSPVTRMIHIKMSVSAIEIAAEKCALVTRTVANERDVTLMRVMKAGSARGRSVRRCHTAPAHHIDNHHGR